MAVAGRGCGETATAHPPNAESVINFARGYNALTLMRSSRFALSMLVALLTSVWVTPAVAQDEDVDLAFFPKTEDQLEDAEARSIQIYRIPISINIRRLENKPWGLRIYFPISLGAYELKAVRDVDEFFTSIQSIAIVPGVEALLPLGDRWLIKPFAEVGVGDDSATDKVNLLYATGLRTVGLYRARPFDLMLGGAFKYRNSTTSEAVKNWYSSIEFGADAQIPLGFSLGSRRAKGGGYAIAQYFTDLDIELISEGPITIQWNYEVGLSFSTDPVLELWKIKMPWIGIGYRFGDGARGVRVNFTFPF